VRRVTKTQTAHDDVQCADVQFGQPQIGERDLHFGEHARHQERIAQLDLVHLHSA
jgi:hypothetical protein